MTLGLIVTEMITKRCLQRPASGLRALRIGLRRKGRSWVLSLRGETVPQAAPYARFEAESSKPPKASCESYGSMILSLLVSQLNAHMESRLDEGQADRLVIPFPTGWDPGAA